MAGSVNKVIIVGNLGKDPELRYTPSGMAVCTFSVATTSGGGKDREAVTEWHRVVVWDKQAEFCNQYLTKGRQVYVEGRLQTRAWDDKQTGQKRSTTEIVANQVVFLGSAADRTGAPRQAPARTEEHSEDASSFAARPQPSRGGNYGPGPQRQEMDDLPPPAFNDDDIPF